MSPFVLYMLDLAGVAVFAVSGALAAGRKSLDWLGVLVIATLTAIGGGTVRDLLLDRHPIFWIAQPTYLVVIAIAALLTLLYVRNRAAPGNALAFADALGLALFTIMGAQIAQGAGLAPMIVVLMATITGVAGGMLRDVLCAEIPLILRRDIYATAAIAGASLYLVLEAFGVPRPWASGLGIITVVALRVLAIRRGVGLPTFTLRDDPR
ncbi:MAG TPA: trimeric intracellular cation channel family protein [Pseudomonadales bacterium]